MPARRTCTAERLDRTAEWAGQELHRLTRAEPVTTIITPNEAYLSKDELMDQLLTVHRALCETGNAITADERLSDLIRSAFGSSPLTCGRRAIVTPRSSTASQGTSEQVSPPVMGVGA